MSPGWANLEAHSGQAAGAVAPGDASAVVTDQGRLRWRCRRGMRELDHLLLRYLDNRWPSATAEEQLAFADLLQFEDDLLWRLLTGAESADDARLADLIGHIAAPRA